MKERDRILHVMSNKVNDFLYAREDKEEDFLHILQNKSHIEILEYLHEKPLGMVWSSPRNKQKHTLFRTIMEHGIDGDEIIKKRLDDAIVTTTDDPKSPEYAFKLDMTPLLEGIVGHHEQVDLIKDVLDIADSEVMKVHVSNSYSF